MALSLMPGFAVAIGPTPFSPSLDAPWFVEVGTESIKITYTFAVANYFSATPGLWASEMYI
jgi:hypothetical protein